MDQNSEVREIEVNVVSSPESSSRNNSPEPPENYRLMNRLSPPNITCYPLIKTSDDGENKNCETVKPTPTSKTGSTSTNFSISSILSRSEPSAKKNGFMGVQTPPQNILETAMGAGCADSAMLSRYVWLSIPYLCNYVCSNNNRII